jgi:hypothetical protein
MFPGSPGLRQETSEARQAFKPYFIRSLPGFPDFPDLF